MFAVCRDAARRAGLSATAGLLVDGCFYNVQETSTVIVSSVLFAGLNPEGAGLDYRNRTALCCI